MDYDQDQVVLLPPSLQEWLAQDRLARVVSDLVDHALDLSERKRHLAAIKGLFVQVLAVCKRAGLLKLRRVALDGTKVRANASRRKAMSYERMTQREAQLAAEIAEPEAQAEALLAEAQDTDDAEDASYGADRRGDEPPAELARRTLRLATIRKAKAKADLKAEAAQTTAGRVRAKAKNAHRHAAKADRAEQPAATDDGANQPPATHDDGGQTADHGAEQPAATHDSGSGDPGDPVRVAGEPVAAEPAPAADPAADPAVEAAAQTAAAAATPKPTAQRNFTDPDSRIMKTPDRNLRQCYNDQAVVDAGNQIIVGMRLTNQAADAPHLPDLLDEVEANPAALPRWLLADAGYFSAEKAAASAARAVDALIATGRFTHHTPQPPAPRAQDAKPKTGAWPARLRTITAREPTPDE